MISVPDAAFLVVAGVVAGTVGTAGGITSLVSYPALLAVGVPALAANAANLVAIAPCWPGSALASRPELRGQGRWLRRWTTVAAVGGAGGAALLLLTPPGVFARVVPFLVAIGSLALLLQPRLAARHAHRRGGRSGTGVILPTGLLPLSVYNGYFGAGSGVMTLALLMVTVDDHLARANALKNMVIGAGNVASSAALVAFGSVDWPAVLPLGVGLFAGSLLGPVVARRLPAGLLRWLVALLGLGLAVELALRGGW
jgi:uncharacterized membrane protein YfcA